GRGQHAGRQRHLLQRCLWRSRGRRCSGAGDGVERLPLPRSHAAARRHGAPGVCRPPQCLPRQGDGSRRLCLFQHRPSQWERARRGQKGGGRMKVFITGTAGFIGFHLARRLLAEGHEVVGYDGMTPYYDVSLKTARHAILSREPRFRAVEAMLEDAARLEAEIAAFAPEIVVHLAAQAGVRYSLEAPEAYVSANLVGTFNLLEALRRHTPRHFLFASTSSVYGGNDEFPFAEADRTDFPVSLYAATKKAGEAMSHSYAHPFSVPTTCFRFFTVYGPWGRPDMALFKFVDAIEKGEPIDVYGMGKMRRDFTYV